MERFSVLLQTTILLIGMPLTNRLLKDPAEFIDHYVELLKIDETIKFQHKVAWNDIISREL